jgi:UDP-N-acetylmuramate-alanine ligase
LIGLGQLLEKYFITEDSVVITGAAGKTTITSMTAWILESAGLDPNVMIGGIMKNIGTGVKISENLSIDEENDKAGWSVTEGDEFKNWHVERKDCPQTLENSSSDSQSSEEREYNKFGYKFTKRSRIHYQKPKYVILTGASWDHYDLFPTQKDYVDNYVEFLNKVPEEGFVVANADGEMVNDILSGVKRHKVYYSDKPFEKSPLIPLTKGGIIRDEFVGYWTENIEYSEKGSEFDVYCNDRGDTNFIGRFELPMMGEINVSNAVAAVAMADQLGIADEQIWKALSTFKGIKKLLYHTNIEALVVFL